MPPELEIPLPKLLAHSTHIRQEAEYLLNDHLGGKEDHLEEQQGADLHHRLI